MDSMRAATYLGPDRIEALRTAIPKPGAGETLVRVDACGICGSDLGIVSGVHPRAKAPLVIGHEFCGQAVQVNDPGESGIRAGDRVTLYPLISCGKCHACRHGVAHVCRSLGLYGIDTDGGMAEYVKVPTRQLLKIPDAMPDEVGALIEPVAVCIHAISREPPQPLETAVVMGAGPIGLLTALVLRHQGVAKVFITDVNAYRLQFAREFGLTGLDASTDEALRAVLEATNGDGADVIYECAGSAPAALQMTDLARCRGRIVNVSIFKKLVPVNMQAVNFKELTLIGARVYTPEDFRAAVEIIGSMPVARLVTHRFALSRVSEAFSLLKSDTRACKVLVTSRNCES